MAKPVSDEVIAKRQAYYRANRERILQKAREWREQNPERYRELQKSAYEAGREVRRARRAELRAEREPLRHARHLASAARATERGVAQQLADREKTKRARLNWPATKRQGFVYVLTHPVHRGLVKVGAARDVNKRLMSYNAGCPDRAYVVSATIPATDALKAESRAHDLLTPLHHSHEWFRCDVETAVVAIRRAVAPSVFD